MIPVNVMTVDELQKAWEEVTEDLLAALTFMDTVQDRYGVKFLERIARRLGEVFQALKDKGIPP